MCQYVVSLDSRIFPTSKKLFIILIWGFFGHSKVVELETFHFHGDFASYSRCLTGVWVTKKNSNFEAALIRKA